MNIARRLSASVFILSLFLFTTVRALAAEEGGSPAEQPIGMTFKWIHFVILAILAYWFFGRLLPPFFRRNADNISAAITRATAAKLEAERKLQDAVSKMASLEREVAEFRIAAQREAAAEVERLQNATLLDIEKIRAAAKAEMEAAERAARIELKQLAAKLAVDSAESLVARQMTPAVQEAMISNFVQSLQGRPN